VNGAGHPTRPALRALAVCEEVELPLSDVRVGRSLRRSGLDRGHVAVLAQRAEQWPPIVVNRADRSVVDGQHRVAAARELGLEHIRVVWFDGSADEAYVEFVRCNVGHGLPLSLDERRAAVRRILQTHADRSDRGIAELCGVSPKTVARVRDELGAVGATEPGATRVGRDGRARPVDAAGVRQRIAEELEKFPEASLRVIARKVGASPETVRSVRNRNGLPERRAYDDRITARDAEATVLALLSRKQPTARPWQDDAALSARDGGEQFVAWFDATAVEDADAWTHLGVVPLSRTYEVADEARRRAAFWSSFAENVERQVRRRA